MNSKLRSECLSADGSIFRAADKVTLAASPVFGLMALLTLHYDSASDPLCKAIGGAPWNGMATMYLLMCAAHLPPWLKLSWLKLLSRRRNGNGRTWPQIKAGP